MKMPKIDQNHAKTQNYMSYGNHTAWDCAGSFVFEYKHLESMRDELQGMTWVSWRGWLMDLGNPKCAPLSLGRLPLR